MFANTLEEVMELQREIFPDRKIPWIQRTLSEQILEMQGKQTEGIFRVPADADEVMCLKAYVDKWEFPDNKGTMGRQRKFPLKFLTKLVRYNFRRSCTGQLIEIMVP